MNIKITSAEIDRKIARLKADISRIQNRFPVLESNLSTRDSQAVPAGAVKSDTVGAKKFAKLTVELNQKTQLLKELEEALRAPLVAHLKLINGKAKTYTMDADDVIYYAFEKEENLKASGVTVKNLVGAEAWHRPAGKSGCNAYAKASGPSITTYIEIRRVADGWRLVHAERSQCYVNQNAFEKVIVSPAANDNIIQKATKNITVRAS